MASSPVRCSGCGRQFTSERQPGSPRTVACPYCGTPNRIGRRRKIVRRRGTAIVETPRGIILVAGKRRRFMLPGGGARKGENRRDAVVRELKEELGLTAKTANYLFSYDDPKDGRRVRSLHKVFLVEAEGDPKPDGHEVRYVEYWRDGDSINLSDSAAAIINRYRHGLGRQRPLAQ